MICHIMHKQFVDLTYHHATLYYVSRVKRLASVNTSWLQICCNLFRKKTKEIQHLQCNFRNFHLLPQSQDPHPRWFPVYHPTPEHKAQMHEALQSCNAVKEAFRAEWQTLEACELRLFGAEWMVKQRDAVREEKARHVEMVRLRAENERLIAKVEELEAKVQVSRGKVRALFTCLKAQKRKFLKHVTSLSEFVGQDNRYHKV